MKLLIRFIEKVKLEIVKVKSNFEKAEDFFNT